MKSEKFSEDYFEGEYREGFYVESMMKRAWAAQIEVLKEIDKVCMRHNLEWFADWGTLLGAVRHKGFIPWDDDIDIVMKREDLNQFLAVAGKELPLGYRILNIDLDEEWEQPHSRVVNRNKISFDEEELIKYHGCPYAVGVDLFCLDYLPRECEAEEVQREVIKALRMLVELSNRGETSMSQHIGEIEQLCGVKLDKDGNLVNQTMKLIDRLCQLYGEEESDILVQMMYYYPEQKYQMRKEWYDGIIYLPFENIDIPVPQNYHEVLTSMYGEYHKFVREMEGAHEYPFYKRQQDTLKKLNITF